MWNPKEIAKEVERIRKEKLVLERAREKKIRNRNNKYHFLTVLYKVPCEEYYEDDYYDNVDDADFVNIYECVEDNFLNYYGYVNDDETINRKKRIIEQWRM